MVKKFDYIEMLGNSLKQLFNNYKIFIPIAIFVAVSFVLNIFYIPSLSPILQGVFDPNFLIYIPILFIVSVMFYSWFFVEIKKIAQNKKIDTLKDLKKGLKYSWRLLGLSIILFLIIVAVFLIFILLFGMAFFAFAINIGFGIILATIVGIITVIVGLLMMSAVMYAPVVLFSEESDVMKTIKKTYNFFMKRKGHCVIMLLIYGAVSAVVSLVGQMILYLIVPATEVQFLMLEFPVKYVALTLPAMVLGSIAYVWVYIFYFHAYKKFKK